MSGLLIKALCNVIYLITDDFLDTAHALRAIINRLKAIVISVQEVFGSKVPALHALARDLLALTRLRTTIDGALQIRHRNFIVAGDIR